jgi:hypothetical protein
VGRAAADGHKRLVVEMKPDRVADVLAVRVGDDELFGLAGFGVVEVVDGEIGVKLQSVGPST